MRILCLHGWRTSGSILKKQTSGFAKALEGVAELEYMDAPFPATGEAQAEVSENFEPPFFEWWDAREEQRDGKTVNIYEGWNESVDAIKARVLSSGPYDGILGFSQGAGFATVLLALQQAGQFEGVQPFKFGIIIAGFAVRDPDMVVALGTPIATPTIHFIGEKDFMKRASGQLLTHYSVQTCVWHAGGHAPPKLQGDGEQEKLLDFLQQFSSGPTA